MNVLLIDQDAAFVGFALRCMRAGHHVRVCMAKDPKDHRRTKIGDGLMEKIENEEWAKNMNWADLVMTSDNNKWLRELDVYKRKGYPVFSPSYESAQLELDRGKGQELFLKAGIKTVPYEVFSDFKKAEKYVLSKGEPIVAKPFGAKAEKSLSHVAKSPKEMVFMLRKWATESTNSTKFMLQDFVEGIEFGIAGWLGPKGFSPWFEEHFEYKKLMVDDYGPNTGEMGTPCRYVRDSPLAKELLLPLERDLMRMGHTGSVAVGAMIDLEQGDAKPLEFTTRLGWPEFNIVQALHPEPCQWIVDMLDGRDSFEPLDLIAVGFVIAMPPFPSDHLEEKDLLGVPLYGLDEDNPYFEQIYGCQVMSGTAPDDNGIEQRAIVSAGNYLAVAVGTGLTVREARDDGLKAVKSINIPNNPIVRTDIGDGLKQELPKLQEHGFARDWTY